MPTIHDRVWITNGGTYTVSVNGTAVAGELTLGGPDGTQTLSLTSGTLLLERGTGNANGVLQIRGGTLGGGGGLFLAGPLYWSGGTITNTLQCAGGVISGSTTKTLRFGCLINAGLLTFSGGYLELQNGATISNLSSGVFEITADCDINQYSTTSGPFYNAGLFRKSGGTGSTSVRAEFQNMGRIEVETGGLNFLDGGHYRGVLAVHSNAVWSVTAGTHEVHPGCIVTCDGTLECRSVGVLDLGTDITVQVLSMNGGRLTGAGAVSARRLVWAKGTIESTVRCAGGEIPSDSVSPPELRGGRLINSGLLVGGLITTRNGATVTNLVTGVIEFTNASAGIRHDGGAPGAFYNAGLVRCTGPTVCSLGEPFYNAGTVRSQGGGFRVASPFVQIAGLTQVEDGPITVLQGLDLRGGALVGTNVVRGNVTNAALVEPGMPLGRLTIEGTYVQSTNGRLRMKIGGPVVVTQHDQLVVTNVARLAGTLEVLVTNGFVPEPGVVITALVCHARSGTFTAAVKPDAYYVLYMGGTVLLETENAPPVVRLEVSPNPLACHPFALRGSAADPDGTVTNLTFLIEGIEVGRFPLQTSGRVLATLDFPGEVICTLQAADNKGALGETNVPITIATLPVHVLDPVGFQTNRAFKLCMCGVPGSNYVIEATTGLQPADWIVLGTMESTNGIWRFLDESTTNQARFYRARQL